MPTCAGQRKWHSPLDFGIHEEGQDARFWAEPIEERFAKVVTYEIYRVVCNLVNALPPKYRDDPD
jgi:hypothetical protein